MQAVGAWPGAVIRRDRRGLCLMGSRMASNLLKRGHSLVVSNRTRAKAEALLAQGATWAESPAAVAEQVEIIFTMLARPDTVEDAALGNDGFLSRLAKGRIWVDCSTVDARSQDGKPAPFQPG